ncbi:hypothetical protein FEZ51_10360 [Pediococcus stilesii]|uniref:Uncharacterized protein n=1 Tax=Pediococcus stilesii TaxID=331679 RepID=A0A5R9BQ58_9LACO|nr:hypothetical protein [Pediococcus stilesii]TLQ02796.1 hypothetical protein FEZ51_10360 [Pediococcus stilesii]
MGDKKIVTLTNSEGIITYPRTKTEAIIDFPDFEKKIENLQADNITFGENITEGLSILNGVKQYSSGGQPFFRLKKIGGDSFIYLFGVFTNIKIAGNGDRVAVMQLPKKYFDGVYYTFSSPGSNSTVVNWEVQDCQLKVHGVSDSTNEWYPVSIYLFGGGI